MKKKQTPRLTDSGKALITAVIKTAATIATSTYLIYGLVLFVIFIQGLEPLRHLPPSV